MGGASARVDSAQKQFHIPDAETGRLLHPEDDEHGPVGERGYRRLTEREARPALE